MLHFNNLLNFVIFCNLIGYESSATLPNGYVKFRSVYVSFIIIFERVSKKKNFPLNQKGLVLIISILCGFYDVLQSYRVTYVLHCFSLGIIDSIWQNKHNEIMVYINSINTKRRK